VPSRCVVGGSRMAFAKLHCVGIASRLDVAKPVKVRRCRATVSRDLIPLLHRADWAELPDEPGRPPRSSAIRLRTKGDAPFVPRIWQPNLILVNLARAQSRLSLTGVLLASTSWPP
jgi:hypothetical protein